MEEQIGLTVGGLILVIVLSVLGTLIVGVTSIFLYIRHKGPESFLDHFKQGMNKLGEVIEKVVSDDSRKEEQNTKGVN